MEAKKAFFSCLAVVLVFPQEMVGEIFMSFRCQMYVNKKVLVEQFLLVIESLWKYIHCFMVSCCTYA